MTTVNATVNITANNANANGNTANGMITANNANPTGANFNGTITATRQHTPPPNNFPAGDDDSNRTNLSLPARQKLIHKKAKEKRFARQQRLNRILPFGQADAMGTGL